MTAQRILVVEDNPITRKMIRISLETEGYDVIEAADGTTALGLAAGRLPDLVLQDFVLPDMDGLHLLEGLRALPGGADLPVLLLTGLVSQSQELAQMGSFTNVLPKPIEPSRLVETIRTHLAGEGRPAGLGRRVLVVDDETLNRKLAALRLRQAGFEVETAATGEEALVKARSRAPDAILCDVLMPGLDGFLLCRALREDPRLSRLPVVLVSSAHVEEEDRRLARESGANALVVRTPDFAEAIEALAAGVREGSRPPPAGRAEDVEGLHQERLRLQLEKQVARNEALLRQGAIHYAALSVLRALSEAIAQPRDLPGVLGDVLVHCLDAAGLSAGVLYVVRPDGSLAVQAQAGLPASARQDAAGCFGHGDLLERAFTSREPMAYVAHGTQHADVGAEDLAQRLGHAAFLVIPFVVLGERRGALLLASDTHDLSERAWISFARALATQFGQTIALAQSASRLAVSEARYRGLVENANDAILVLDAGETILEANRQAEVLLGAPRGQIAGRPYAEFVPPEEREDAAAKSRKLAAEGSVRVEKRHLLRADGGRVAAVVSASRVQIGDEPVTIVILHDVTERMRAEEALADSERRYRLIFAANPLPMWVFDRETLRFLDVNEAAVRQYGYSREELLGMTIKDVRPPEDVPALLAFLSRPAAAEPITGVRHLRKDGTLIEVELTVQDTAFDGRPARIVVARDVTEPRRAEKALRESQQLLQALLDGAQAVIYVKDLHGRFVLVNRRFETLAGLKREQMLGKTDHDIFPGEAADRFRENDLKVLETREPLEFEEVAPDEDGPHTYVSLKYPLFDSGGVPYAVCGISTDLTEHKRAEAERRRLSVAVEQAAESILITDPDGTMVYVNPAFERVSGYSRAEALGRNPRIVKSGKQNAAFYRELWATLVRGEVWRGRFVNRRKDGTLYEEEAAISPMRDADGSVTHYVSVQRDLTQERKLEARLVQAQKMEAVGQLAGGVAHDFNNLLGVITGYADLLLREGGPEDRGRRRLEQIRKAADRAAALTRQLLAFSRKQVLQPKVLDLNALVEDVEKMLRRLISEDIQLVTAFSPKLGRAKADPGQLEQVIVNLAVNARDAMPRGGKLILETANVELDAGYSRDHPEAQPGAHVVLAVSDTGVGIDAATLTHIFEPFFTTKANGKGTGLGLATVYGIVKQSGGHVSVYTEPGRGTTFKVYLPRVEEQPEAAAPAPLEPPRRGSETVLLVEDEASLRVVVRELLEDAGYRVVEAGTPEDGLSAAGSHEGPIHLLLTDVIMPGASGQQMAQRLLSARPGARVLFMSGGCLTVLGRQAA